MENVLQTGLDRSLPHIGVIMQKFDTGRYPKFTLPGGFSFCSFRPGLEEQWARLQHQVGGIDSLQEARTIFYQEFLLGKGYNWLRETPPAPAHTNPASFPCYEQMCKRMVFITDSQSQLAGTAALWQGTLFGRPLQRIHWVAVRAGCQGLGFGQSAADQGAGSVLGAGLLRPHLPNFTNLELPRFASVPPVRLYALFRRKAPGMAFGGY